ncbi:glucose-1-phosphate adenylyltransferase [Albibacterium indicum]|uniref:glucose-1-phosphate adenylyltransferase n=1 Tax=Albibacterium indicum TaxID=2292082 RepID=UPI000E4B63B6|nr:glucose-1-phosphate adenylyltransferase [Pedobacter indicus]
MKSNVISIVLGGGRGTRLNPLTLTRSKPAVPIAGKYRLVDIPISNCLNSELNRIFVLTQYNSASLNSHIKNTYNFSVFDKGFVDILAAEQNMDGDRWYQGTADAVRKIRRYLEVHDYDYILILSGDQLYQMNFQKLIDFHIQNSAKITLATIPVSAKDATSFGILKSNEESQITSFIEKPSADLLSEWKSEVSEEMRTNGREYLASMGIYMFDKGVLADLLIENDGLDFGKELIPYAIEKSNVFSYQYDGYWTDIGNIDSFFEANIGLTDDIPAFNLFDSNTIFSRSRMLPPSKFAGCLLDRVIVADGCIINADKVERSVIGVRSRIGRGTVIRNTYMMGADYYQDLDEITQYQRVGRPLIGVGERCYIDNTIIDKSACIGNDVRINGGKHLEDGDFDTYTVRDGIVVIKKKAVIPNNTVIGAI